MTFSHLLTQIHFKLINGGKGITDAMLSGATVKLGDGSIFTTVTPSLSAGAMTVNSGNADAKGDVTVTMNTGTGNREGYCVIPPQNLRGKTLTVTLPSAYGSGVYSCTLADAAANDLSGGGGYAYLFEITVEGKEIKVTSTIKAWDADGSGNTGNVTTTFSPLAHIGEVQGNEENLVGKVVASDGFIYDSKAQVTAAGKTVVGMIGYIGAPGTADGSSATYKGLIIGTGKTAGPAMAPASTSAYSTSKTMGLNNYVGSSMAYCLADIWGIDYTERMKTWGDSYMAAQVTALQADVSTLNFAHSDWFIPAMGQWLKVLNAFGAGFTESTPFTGYMGSGASYAFLQNTLNPALENAGAASINKGASTSSECDETHNLYFLFWNSSQTTEVAATSASFQFATLPKGSSNICTCIAFLAF